jgi:hypothetical protein
MRDHGERGQGNCVTDGGTIESPDLLMPPFDPPT